VLHSLLSVPTRRSSDLAAPLADRDAAHVEGELQRPLRRLPAGPGMVLLDQHVVVDVADREWTALAEEPHHLPQFGGRYLAEPWRSEEHTSELQSRENLV